MSTAGTPLAEAARFFAFRQYLDYVIYTDLAAREPDSDLKRILLELVGHEMEDFRFWQTLSDRKEFRVGRATMLGFRLVRALFGLTFTAKLLESREKRMISLYSAFLEKVEDPAIRERIAAILEHENLHESRLIGQVQEEKIQFLSSIVLGLNDGLIELTGALVGFAFALRRPSLVAVTGSIAGIAASLSMAASAYMQAHHEEGKDPRKAALYTGLSYLAVVAVLVTPFGFASTIAVALPVLAAEVLLIVAGASVFTSVILERNWGRQFLEMLLFSVGVAAIAFAIGQAFRAVSGISIS